MVGRSVRAFDASSTLFRIQRRARIRLLWEEQHGFCWYCARYVRSRDATLDHVIPQSIGGTDDMQNLVMACAPCNNKKDDHLTDRVKTPGRLAALIARGTGRPTE